MEIDLSMYTHIEVADDQHNPYIHPRFSTPADIWYHIISG